MLKVARTDRRVAKGMRNAMIQPTRDRESPLQNHLLAALPDAEYRRWQPLLELVDMPLGQVICELGAKLCYAYFPCTAIVSLL